MVKLFLDIETLPSSEGDKDTVLSILEKRKSNLKNGFPTSKEDLYLSTSFDGTFGRICCVGFIKEDGEITKGVLEGTEEEMLKKFWEIAQNVDLFIGHNIFEFDLPFIYKRSIIFGIKPSKNISFAKYKNDSIFDTMFEWEKWAYGEKHSLDTLARVLKLPSSKDTMNGSEVWSYYKEGRLKEIQEYCMKDVELTRLIYYKMIFEKPRPISIL
jgi:predicted PolB exonuclease-like 3'-5' exonuclease